MLRSVKMLFCLIMLLIRTYTSGALRTGIERQTVYKMENTAVAQEWIIKRNCSITPKQLLMVYAVLCTVSLSIALFFTARGAWYVLGFAVLEMAAVGVAFLHFGRHAMDREHLELTDRLLAIKLVQAGKERRFHLDPHSTRIAMPRSRDELISLEDKLVRVEVGRFLNHSKRQEFAAELRHCLSASK
jgi:uncharacterized membrane protein